MRTVPQYSILSGTAICLAESINPITMSRRFAHGAPLRTRRTTGAPARSERKSSKERFSLEEALRKDRERIERNQKLPWRERFEQLRVYPWKTFIVFMAVWSYAGLYVVPWLKGVNLGEVPRVTPTGHEVPVEIQEKLSKNPSLGGWVRQPVKSKEKLPETNKDAPRF